jgi:tetratricopeptide (TPR) repeat protein
MCLLEQPNELVSKETLLDAGWKDVAVTEQSLAEAVGTLRRVLEDDPKKPAYIQTVHRRGYRFIAPVTTDGSGAVEAAAPRVSSRRYGVFLTLALVVVLLAVAGVVYLVNRSPTPIPFEERDWVLIADFENRSGESEFDDVLSHALEWELSSSRFVNVALPGGRIGDTLQLMRKPPDTPISEDIGREVCIRDGGIRALISGRIEKLGSTYVLSAKLIDPPTATTVAVVSEDATDEDTVPDAVRRLSKQLRMTLGESLAQLTESEVELEKVTTPSLRALRLFSQGMALVNQHKWEPAAELLARSVAEDPEFVTAHIYLAHCYSNLRRHNEAAPHYQQAFALADRTTEQERHFILGSYYHRVLKDYEKAIASFEALLQIEPDHYWGVNNLANDLSRTGRYQESVRYSLRRAELRPNSDINNLWAAKSLAVIAQDLDAAKPYAARARKLQQASEEARPHPNWMAWIDFLPAFEMWLMNDPATARGAVEELENTISVKTGVGRELH